MNNFRFYFAQAYGKGTYSECSYNNTASCTSTGSSGTSGSGNQLTNTGFDILVLATIACLLIFTALVVRLWRKKRGGHKASTKQPPQDTPNKP